MSEPARKLLPEETQPTDDELAHELEKIWGGDRKSMRFSPASACRA